MANGDLAASAGLTVFPDTQDRRKGYDNDNIRGDDIARHILEGGHSADKVITSGQLAVAKGGTGGSTAQAARDNLSVVQQGGGTGMGPNRVKIGWAADSSGVIVQVDNTTIGKVVFQGQVPAPDLSGYQQKGVDYQAGNGVLVSAGGRNTQVSSGYVAAYFNGDGTLRSTPSARRFKQDITGYDLTPDEVAEFLAIQAVHYRLRAEVEAHGDDAPTEFGFIAEDVLEHGFGSVVPIDNWEGSDTIGLPISVDYARLVVPLHNIVKQQHAELAQLRSEVAEMRALIAPTEGTD